VSDEATLHPDLEHPYMAKGGSDLPVIKVLSGPSKGKEYTLDSEEYIIGRDLDSNIVVEDHVVSRRHALIKRKVSEYVICDLDSTNGIYVNNLKMTKAVLHHGDLVQIGACVFQFVWDRKR
jgi:pSer/pThr/pTyr-binding forkhead associated (FHA) protein